MDKHNRLWELLGKRASGEITTEELHDLTDLLKDEGENVQYMMNVLDHYWVSVQNAEEKIDPQIVYESQVKQLVGLHIQDDQIKSGTFGAPPAKWKYSWWWAAAASICIAGGWLAYDVWVKSTPEMNVVTTRNGSKTRVTLPDGTEVWLNSGSKLTYPNDFQHVSKREVSLSGEAYFDVKHDANRSFIIHTDFLDIKDLGTVFNVKAYPDDQITEATLISGSIAVTLRSDPGRTLILKPHEKISYYAYKQSVSLQKDKLPVSEKKAGDTVDLAAWHTPARVEITEVQPMIHHGMDTIVSETAWTKNQLVFQSENFSRLADRMERWYNVTIIITDPDVKNYTFTGIFESETLEQALKELQMIRPLRYEIVKDTVVINK